MPPPTPAQIVDEHLKANQRRSLRCDPALLTWEPPPAGGGGEAGGGGGGGVDGGGAGAAAARGGAARAD